MMNNIPEEDMRNVSRAASNKAGEVYETVKDAVVSGYKAIENAVTGGYKAIENGVVSGYRKIENAFVGRFLTKEGESVEDAKKRLTHQNQSAEPQANDQTDKGVRT